MLSAIKCTEDISDWPPARWVLNNSQRRFLVTYTLAELELPALVFLTLSACLELNSGSNKQQLMFPSARDVCCLVLVIDQNILLFASCKMSLKSGCCSQKLPLLTWLVLHMRGPLLLWSSGAHVGQTWHLAMPPPATFLRLNVPRAFSSTRPSTDTLALLAPSCSGISASPASTPCSCW